MIACLLSVAEVDWEQRQSSQVRPEGLQQKVEAEHGQSFPGEGTSWKKTLTRRSKTRQRIRNWKSYRRHLRERRTVRDRVTLALSDRGRLYSVSTILPRACFDQHHVLKGLWPKELCSRVLQAAQNFTAIHGWRVQRHRAFPTTDIPCWRVTEVHGLVRERLTSLLFPALSRCYQTGPRTEFELADLFFVKYSAQKGAQRELAIHRDGSPLSFNILLNSEEAFTGKS